MESIYGTKRLKIKYQKTDIHVTPGGTSNALGELRKGAVVTILEDSHPYYYFVQLDNGLEGYVYKAAGEITADSVTALPEAPEFVRSMPVETPSYEVPASSYGSSNGTMPAPSRNGNGNGVSLPETAASYERPRSVTPRRAPLSRPSAAESYASSRNAPKTRIEGGGPGITVTSAEIAVFDTPGIVGRQVAKLRRGEQANLIRDDGFFFEIRLSNGIVGFIPRYAAEQI